MAQHTVIAHQTHVKGTLRGDQPVEVRGLLEGHVQLEEVLTVAQEGQVIAQVQVREAIIHGLMRGTLKASERIIITSNARVEGTIEAPVIRVDDGARVRGEVVMDVEGVAPVVKPSTVRASAPAQAAPTRSSWSQPAAPKVEAPAPTPPAPEKTPEAPKAQEVEVPVEAQVGAFTSPARQGASAAAAAAAAARAPRTSSNVATISAPEPAQEPEPEVPAPSQDPEETEAIEEPSADEPTPSAAEPEDEPIADEPEDDEEDLLDEEAHDDEHRPAVNLSAEVLAEYDDYTVKELREALRRIDLPVSGTKTELIERLVEAKSQG